MIEIDGSKGEGGGQVLRSALALSAVTGKAFTIANIRGNRKKPGLLKQHLTGVKAAREVCNGDATGGELYSRHLVFTPGNITPREFNFQIGSAGSTTLVAQTVLPALIVADRPSRITVEGGTHNTAAPPYDYLDRCYLPLVERMGVKFTRRIDSYGFFPVGGGKIVIDIEPVQQLKGIEILERGGQPEPTVTALVSNLPLDIGHRECGVIRRSSGWKTNRFFTEQIKNSPGCGNVVMIQFCSPNVTELFTGFGKRGIKAEDVARDVYRQAKEYLESDAPVGQHLADQLLLPMGIAAAGGRTSSFRTHILSTHSKTHIEILRMFLDIRIDMIDEDGAIKIEVGP